MDEPREVAEQFLARFEEIEEIERERIAGLKALDALIRQQFSYRQFFERILPPSLVSPATWQRWLRGDARPRPEKWRQLVPYLREHLGLAAVTTARQIAEAQADADEAKPPFDLSVAPPEFLDALLAAAALQANHAEHAPDPAEANRDRLRAHRLLTPLADLVEDERPVVNALGAAAAITQAALRLSEHADGEAQRLALAGAFALEAAPELRQAEPPGYPGWAFADVLILGYLRAATAAHKLGNRQPSQRYLTRAYQYTGHTPRSHRWQLGIMRDAARSYLDTPLWPRAFPYLDACLREYEKLRLPDDALLYYLTAAMMCRFQTRAARFDAARAYRDQAESLEVSGQIGWTHRCVLLGADARLTHAEGDRDRWLDVLNQLVDLASRAGLDGEIFSLQIWLDRLSPDDQAAVAAIRDRLSWITSQTKPQDDN